MLSKLISENLPMKIITEPFWSLSKTALKIESIIENETGFNSFIDVKLFTFNGT